MKTKEDTKAIVNRILRKHWKYLLGEKDGERAVFDGMYLDGWDFGLFDLRKVEFRNTSLVMASFRRSNLREAVFRGCDARGADMRNANLREVKVVDSVFAGCMFDGAILDGAVFRCSKLTRSSFVGSSMCRVVLDCSDAEWDAIDGAISKADDVLFNLTFKAWSKEDIQKSAMVYVADNTHLDEAHARKKIDDIVGYIIDNEKDLRERLSDWDCEDIDNAVSVAAQEVGL